MVLPVVEIDHERGVFDSNATVGLKDGAGSDPQDGGLLERDIAGHDRRYDEVKRVRQFQAAVDEPDAIDAGAAADGRV